MPNTYIDPPTFIRGTHGLEAQSLVGNSARFTTAQMAAATSLSVPASGLNSVTVQLNLFDQIVIFDGSTTEVMQVGAAGAAIGAISIPLLSPLLYTHAVGVAWCSDGVSGSLADQIINASAWIETTCNQSLLLTTYTNEQLVMPTMRAAIDNQGELVFRPRHWPIQSIATLAIAMTNQSSTAYDVTQVQVDSDKQMCTVPNLLATATQGQTPYPILARLSRQQKAQLTISYQAGYAYSALPGDLKEAAVLATSDLVAKRYNPIGAPDVSDGSSHISASLRGDFTGESLLIKRTMKILVKYTTESF